MQFRKEILFVLAAISLILTNTNNAQAAEVIQMSTELPFSQSYDYKSDPFLLEWTFAVEKTEKPAESPATLVVETKETKILNRWKEKQSALWKTLPKGQFVINASAYTAAADECGGKSDGITASGLKVEEKRTLACPPSYPFGTKVKIDGMGEFRCEDRGGAIKGNKFDIYMETKKEAFSFGRRNLVAEVIE